jgi:hypothetical protein
MKHFRCLLIIAVLVAGGVVSFGQVEPPVPSEPAYAFGFTPESRIPASGTIITIPLFAKAENGFTSMDATIKLDPGLEFIGQFSFDWRVLQNSFKASYFNERTRELKIAVANYREVFLYKLVKIGSFRVKVPDAASSTQYQYRIDVVDAVFDIETKPVSNGMRITVGPRVFLGDVNLNGIISAVDAALCLKISLSDEMKKGLTTVQFLSGDVDGDGDITENDAGNILQKAVNPENYHFPAEDFRTGGTSPGIGSVGSVLKPTGDGCSMALNLSGSATSGRFDISLPPGVILEPNGLSQVMTAQRYDEGTGVLSVAFAGDVSSGTLFTLRGANASKAEISGRLNGVDVDVRKETVTGVEDISPPTGFTLGQNYPNPFNPSTKISFTMPKAGSVTLKVFDMQGREIATLVEGELGAGNHETVFDASRLTSGTYIYRLVTRDFVETKKMVLLK